VRPYWSVYQENALTDQANALRNSYTARTITGTQRYPDPSKLMDKKTCREKMRHMLVMTPTARVFLATLRDRINGLDETGHEL